MPSLVLDLLVDRVDLVDEGANSEAFIKLYKRKERRDTMTFEEILAKMKPEHAEVVKQYVADKDLTVDLNKAKEKITELEGDLEKVAKSKTVEEPAFEDVLKSLDPAVQEVFKSMQAQKDAAEAVAKQAADERLNTEAIAKAKELKALPVDETKLVEVLKSITPEVHEILKAANKAISEDSVFEEIGKTKTDTSSGAGDAWGKIEKKAKAIEVEQKVSKAKAISIAVNQNPDLYKEYLEGGAN